ncbi:stAR-related lipid transfer protein 6 isoform X1 [Prionailurus iriomotensis]
MEILYRVEGIIPESTTKLSEFLYKPENRVTWDKSLKVYNMVHKIDSRHIHMSYHYTKFCHGLNFPPRLYRLSILQALRREYGYYQLEANSVDFPAYPPSSNYIRGYNHACGYICSPLKENPAHSKLVMFVQTEMKGKLSPSIIEATMPSNLISFILNAKDGIKAHRIPSGHGSHPNGHSSFLKKK